MVPMRVLALRRKRTSLKNNIRMRKRKVSLLKKKLRQLKK